MKKRIFSTGFLIFALLAPASGAYAQGYPTFDVAKLAGLITNLVGRFQPIPQVLSRVNQVKSTISQIQAVGTAVVSGDLKSLGKMAAGALKSDAFSNGRPKSDVASAAEGDDGAKKASQKVKDTLFSLKENVEMTMDDVDRLSKARDQYVKDINEEARARVMFILMNATEQAKKRFEKAEEALSNAESIQDSINANTMTIMAGNFERLNQIALALSSLRMNTASHIYATPLGGYRKPDPYKLELGDVKYTAEEKGGPDVDL